MLYIKFNPYKTFMNLVLTWTHVDILPYGSFDLVKIQRYLVDIEDQMGRSYADLIKLIFLGFRHKNKTIISIVRSLN